MPPKIAFYYLKSRQLEGGEYSFTIVIFGPDKKQVRVLPEIVGRGYSELLDSLYKTSISENTLFREIEGVSKILVKNILEIEEV